MRISLTRMISFDKHSFNGFGHIAAVIVGLVVIVFLSRSLNPFSQQFFSQGHDETQAARVMAFTDNLRHSQVPPRMAPDFAFGFGYPIFNFYAPTAYWIAGLIHLFIPDIVVVLKLVYILPLLVAYYFMFRFLRTQFSLWPAFLGASLYVTSIYFGTDIFVRTNLAETWFLAFAPLSLFVLHTNAVMKNRWIFLVTTITLSLCLTVHNILSVLWIPVLVVYLLLLPNKKKNGISLALAFLLAAAFFVPLIAESKLVYLSDIAGKTDFHRHFLCPDQLWKSPWGYGGSNPDCADDGMSFMVGKPQLLMALFGLLMGFFWKGPHRRFWIFFFVLTLGSLLSTTYWSAFFWDLLSPITSMIQFPWRLIAFSLVGSAYMAAYFWEHAPIPLKTIATIVIIFGSLLINGKYFTQPLITAEAYKEKFVHETYVARKVVYQMPEYIPRTADYAAWKKYDISSKTGVDLPVSEYATAFLSSTQSAAFVTTKNDTYVKTVQVLSPQTITANVLYFPYWRFSIDSAVVQPTTFDALGRPLFVFTKPGTLTVSYQQTAVEMVGNIISLVTFIGLIGYTGLFGKLWTALTAQRN